MLVRPRFPGILLKRGGIILTLKGWLSIAGAGLILTLHACGGNPYEQGERIYIVLCSNCHMEDGSGLGQLIPALTEEKLTLDQPARLICLLRKGLPRNPQTNQQMPAQPTLSVTEMTNLINYLGYVHAGRRQSITLDEVIEMEGACQSR